MELRQSVEAESAKGESSSRQTVASCLLGHRGPRSSWSSGSPELRRRARRARAAQVGSRRLDVGGVGRRAEGEG
jgi:hypothetical protein